MPIEITEQAAMAAHFVNSTNKHIFLTGKAGTGKTTFLRELANSTHKSFVTVAPTGIAALNASGVTIHSMFLLPFGTFLPTEDYSEQLPEDSAFYNQRTLARRHPLNAERRETLQKIDLLIIDEVSMLRADVLDVIDYRLKSVRRNFRQSFGGVQLLMIGDLYQLPPVVKDFERARLARYYKSPHFFEALCLKQDGFVYVELDKIFRQSNQEFIEVLNNLRNNQLSTKDIELLNSHYDPDAKAEEGVITLCTHNRQADSINRKELDELKGKSHYVEAEVEDEFPDRIFPVLESLELKVGAQIMFIKNDSADGMYYNGSIAKVVTIEDEEIFVELRDSGESIELKREVWENKKYKVNQETKELDEKVIGRFSQYPVKLAWAVTVHKSQGLTFDKAVIDVGQAFAPGQVYVALSRLSSMEGLILKTPINPSVVSSDQQVVNFSKAQADRESLSEALKQGQKEFLQLNASTTFSFDKITFQIADMLKKHDPKSFADTEMQFALDKLISELQKEKRNTAKFRSQLAKLLLADDTTQFLERIEKGSDYYFKYTLKRLEDVLLHLEHVKQFSKTKAYQNALSELDTIFMKKLADLEKASHISRSIIEEKAMSESISIEDILKSREEVQSRVYKNVQDNPKNAKTKTGKKRKKKTPNRPKGATYEETYALAAEGLNMKEVADKRGMAVSTIESHFSRGVREGRIELDTVLDKKKIKAISKAVEAMESPSSATVYHKLGGKFTYGEIRMVLAGRGNKS